MDRLSIGIIGCGAMARDLAARCVALGQTVLAVSDPDPAAVEAARSQLGARDGGAAEAVCADPEVNAILVGSPPGLHEDHVLAAAAHGKPIYCEKPLATTVAACDRMIRACESAGVPLFVGQVLRLFPLFWRSRTLIAEGVIGEPRAVSITRAGYSAMFQAGWRREKRMAGGLLLEVNAHEFDYLRVLLGPPVSCYASLASHFGQTDYEDQGFVIVQFANGATGMLHTSLSSPTGEYRVHIQGTEGSMVHGGFGGSLRYQSRDGEAVEEAASDLTLPNPYDRELQSWIASLLHGEEPLFTGVDGRWAVAMAEAAYASANSGMPEPVV